MLPLHLSAFSGNFKIATLLINEGTPILIETGFKDTVLHIAIR